MRIEQATTNDAAEILALQKLAYVSEAEIYDDFGIQPLTQTVETLSGNSKPIPSSRPCRKEELSVPCGRCSMAGHAAWVS